VFSKTFWASALERAVKTFAQSLIAVLGFSGAGLLSSHWTDGVGMAGAAALLSLLTSIGSAAWGPYPGTPSITSAPPTDPTINRRQ
jgi:Putative lactococcus lactis phage r1t holin